MEEYEGATIINIRRGTGDRVRFVYADLVSKTGELLVSADLDYVCSVMKQRLPGYGKLWTVEKEEKE